ncbi:receptor-like protein 33 [Gossypium hirsutum]|uniref:Receptor-like protein 33 n=1 Tax=Gossypium hirsutum TaxID=3635 RepID=A0ABM3BJ58_GOSHI|nr:receptor-like protein 33 [Gossypium hirsutum]
MDSWDEDTDCCKWEGVMCDNRKGNVIDLDLNCSGISGSLQSNSSLFSLQNLRSLNLAGNCFCNSKIPSEFGKLRSLNYLNLSDTALTGFVPHEISLLSELVLLDLAFGNLTKITFLDISSNMFQGQIRDVFWNLNDLSFMDFSSNNFSGLFPSLAFNLTSLTFMDFSSNFLQGRLFSLPSLQYLNLDFNKLNGPIDTIQEANLVQLVDLSKNEIQGTIPSSFFDLMNLTILDLSSNNLSGNIKSCMLVKLKNLRSHNHSFNNLLSLTRCSNDVNSTLPKIINFHFSSCNMQCFPSFLNASKSLQVLDLSNNQIHGSITKWEAEGWEGLDTLNLSMNFITTAEQIPGKHMFILDLRFNSLQGPLPPPPQLGRTIPYCFGTFSDQLSAVVLGTLNLNGNQLEGSIPPSLKNYHNLEVFDLGNNNINDTFPYWLGTRPHLQVLVLRSNRFHGEMQNYNGTFSFSSLQMIDLSRNGFTGHIPPELFENLKSMKDILVDKSGPNYMGGNYYQDSVIITMKGLDFKLERILTSFTVIDFSSNHFKGSIAKEVGELNSLIVLNFSHNSLAGNILPSLGKMAALESLDLSSNKLQGRIPIWYEASAAGSWPCKLVTSMQQPWFCVAVYYVAAGALFATLTLPG